MKKKNIKKKIIAALVIVLIFVGGFFLFQEIERFGTEKDIEEEKEEVEEVLEIILYFVETIEGQEQLVEVTREIPFTHEVRSASIEELLKGPLEEEREKGITTAISREAEMRSFGTDLSNRVFVDFNKEIEKDVTEPGQVAMIREQIEKTLQHLENVEGVVISVEGDEDALRP